jgi:hypothetical protein
VLLCGFEVKRQYHREKVASDSPGKIQTRADLNYGGWVNIPVLVMQE